jgi:hypothetical protein
VAKVIDGEAIIMNLSSGVYYSMDGVGGFIWERLEGGCGPEEIARAIATHYEVDESEAADDLGALLEELLEEGVIVSAEEERASETAWPDPPAERQVYARPELSIYRDMGDLLALDPPAPGMQDIPWKE